MSNKSNNQGRAYEYAWIHALFDKLVKTKQVTIVANSSYQANKRVWDSNFITDAMRKTFIISAEAAVNTILELEPLMLDGNDEILLIAQKDEKGISGDVRDIVIKQQNIEWEVGLSVKHNHEAVKHSRLSHKLDFGKEWFGIPCSAQYWADIKPIFDMLKAEKKKNTKFSELTDKEGQVYVPLLEAFIKEVNRAYSSDNSVARRMIEYLIGKTDYYKVISRDSKKLTLIRTFNLHGTLNKPSAVRVSAITVPVVTLPTRIVALQMKPDSNTTIEMYLDNGWQLSFRIHNAEDKIIPTLKFDIQFIGMPPEVTSIECRWDKK